eukprot:10954579-Prorocentrum_lima.AAC.1
MHLCSCFQLKLSAFSLPHRLREPPPFSVNDRVPHRHRMAQAQVHNSTSGSGSGSGSGSDYDNYP